MKKFIFLLLVPIFIIGLVKVKAYDERYAVQFESTECEMPVGGDIYEYLPEAYVYDVYTEEEVTRDNLIYAYDYQGIKIENVKTNTAGDYYIYMTAYSEEYNTPSAFSRINIHIYDNIEPVISMNDHISIPYTKDFNINEYLHYTDNAETSCSVVVLGSYRDHKVGDYELTVVVTDRSNNASERDFYLNIYDDIAPVITCEDYIDVEFDREINLRDYIKVIDGYDGEIDYEYTSFDKSILGESVIVISATDSSNNTSTKEVTINVCDKTKPTILINEKELNINEDYNLYDNVISVTDNHDELEITDISINKKKVGTKRYVITYTITDSSNNIETVECLATYTYNNAPIIEGINLDDLKDVFDPLYYVNCYDVEDGDLNDKVMVIEMNYKDKYCIYEVYDSDDNVTRTRIDFVNLEDLEKYENTNTIVFLKEEEKTDTNSTINNDNRNVNEFKNTNYNFIYYIVLGVLVLGIIIFIIIKHFRKKMV